MSSERGERILGPYEDKNGWRVVEIDAHGNRTSTLLATEVKAVCYVDVLRAALAREDQLTESALAEYLPRLGTKGDKAASIDVTAWAIGLFCPEPLPLRLLSSKRCASLYENLRTRTRMRPGSAKAGAVRRGLVVLNGGVQAPEKKAQ